MEIEVYKLLFCTSSQKEPVPAVRTYCIEQTRQMKGKKELLGDCW